MSPLETRVNSLRVSWLFVWQAWLNEKFSPELLENKSEVVECVMEQLTHMVNLPGNTFPPTVSVFSSTSDRAQRTDGNANPHICRTNA